MTARELVFACSYTNVDPADSALLYNTGRCQSYLGGVIDVFRWTYSDLGVQCLPNPFSVNILKRDILEAAAATKLGDEVMGAVLVDLVMSKKYGCPTLLRLK